MVGLLKYGSTGKRWRAVNVLAIAGTFGAIAANNQRL